MMRRYEASGRLDWPGLMRAGLVGLRLRPQEFWALSPAELALLLGDMPKARPLTRARLEELAQAFPDRRGPEGESDG
ncbi:MULTISPECIES: rcc01693 family protein [Thioclava]|uniref:Phage tail assembly chaperone n=1 Tax=Thioclava litoralis TaxID=3076557 RepID=A0ABZ1DZ61_9RHOB|nr:phage tail assembly chaperone [Thioclava sp. FTW29]